MTSAETTSRIGNRAGLDLKGFPAPWGSESPGGVAIAWKAKPPYAPSGRYCASLGHKQDDESGLIYMRARYYDPGSGRFVSEDPGKSGSNWFVYAGDQPSTRCDRSGSGDTWDWLITAVLSGLVSMLSALALHPNMSAVAAAGVFLAGFFAGVATCLDDALEAVADVSLSEAAGRLLDVSAGAVMNMIATFAINEICDPDTPTSMWDLLVGAVAGGLGGAVDIGSSADNAGLGFFLGGISSALQSAADNGVF